MALQVWLHGKDLINRGLCPNNASWVGSATYVDGKLGKCYSCTSSHYIDYTYNFASTNKFTIAFWIYIPASLSTCNKWECVFSLPEYPISWASYNNLKIYDISNNQLWWLDGSMFYDKWVHLTIAHNADTITLYINGDHYNTANSVSSPISSGTMHVGNGITDAHGPVKFNDIRLYDHCLSPKEVKEISKGLVLHYPLNDAYVEGTTNIASNLSPSQIGGWQKMTITKLSTNNYHLKHQTSDSANLSYWSTFVYTLPSEYSNKTISFSARIKNIVYNNIKDSSWLYIGPGNNGQYPTHGRATFYCYELKENQLISWTGVLSNSNRYVLVELWNDANSTSGSIEFDLVDIQIEEKDHVTPYTPNTRNETIVYDCSGYQNNGTVEEFKAAGNNLVTGLTAGGQTTVSGETVTTSGVNADTYFTINLSESIVIGQTYTLSCIGKNIPTDGYFEFPLGWQGNTSLIFNIKNGYNEITFTANDGSWGTNHLFMDDYGRATAYMNKCEFTGFKLYKHSIVNSGLNAVFDSPRYKIGAKFNGQHSIWLSSPLGSGAKEELTVSFWHKPNSQGNYRTIASNNYPHSGFWIGCNCEGYGLWYYGGGFYVQSQNFLSNDVWYHCALTYKNQTYQWYLNGVPVTTSIYGTFKVPTFSSSISIGGNTNGDMKGSSGDYRQWGSLSDFRIYSTALSADDIKELYNTSCIINS